MKRRKTLLVVSTTLCLASWLVGCTESTEASSWVSAGTLLEARSGHSAIRVDKGAVLFVGGENATGKLATSEMRDTATSQWSTSGSLKDARTQHAAVKRGDGHVMVIGGTINSDMPNCIEVFDPNNGQFTVDDSFEDVCPEHPAAALVEWSRQVGVGADETSDVYRRVVVTDGTTSKVHLYDPDSNTWPSEVPSSLLAQRLGYTATVLTLRRRNSIFDVPDGSTANDVKSKDGAILLVVGGAGMQPIAEYLDIVACASDAQCTWKAINSEDLIRHDHTATWIGNDEVLVVGGKDDANPALATTKRYRYNWDSDTWTVTSAQSLLHVARYGHTATRLNSGNVLIVGGRDASAQPIDSVEMYDVASDAILEMPPMSSPRAEHTATWLPDGSVLVAGGVNTDYLETAERFVPENTNITCQRTEECPQAMICNAEQYCEQTTGTLGSTPACTYAGERGSGGAATVAGWFALLLGAWSLRRRRASKRGAAAFVGAAMLLVPSLSRAQARTFYLDRLQIAGGSEDGIGVWRPIFGKTGVFGQIAVGYSHNPLHVATYVHNANQAQALSGPAVSLQMTGYATVGVNLAKHGAIQVSVPYVMQQSGHPTDERTAGLEQVVDMASSALGDVRIDGRMLVAWNDSQTLNLAVRVAAFLPTGNEYSFTGEGTVWGNASLSVEYNLALFFLTANAGLTMRPKSSLQDLTLGNELVYGCAAYVPLNDNRVRLGAELWGSFDLSSGSAETTPVEAALSGRMALGASRRVFLGASAGGRIGYGYAPDLRLVGLVGGVLSFERAKPVPRPSPVPDMPETDTDKDGVVDMDDQCPLVREDFKRNNDGCPETDEDGDGIDTSVDACPTEPEDKDGLADGDGCPETDADGDGFLDEEDKCPKAPGVRHDDPEKLGCPQFIKQTTTQVQISQQIEFDFRSATISPSSYPILDEVAKLLKANPDITQLRIEGHTDNVGSAVANQNMSVRRAQAVRDYLVKSGNVEPSRLIYQGFGQTKPIASNDTEEGRAKNRRVEFYIVNAADDKEKKP